MTRARVGIGTLLQSYVGADWETVAEVKSVGGPKLDSTDVDVTNFDSPSGYKEFIAGLKEAGECSLGGNLIPEDATQQRLITDQKAGTVRAWRIVLPGTGTVEQRPKWTFDAYVKSLSFNVVPGDALTFDATLKISGEPTLSSSYAPDLTGLTVTTATLVPAFGGTVYAYGASVANETASVTVTPTCAAADAITVNGTVVLSEEASAAISLAVGVNAIVIQTQEAGKTPRNTTITIIRAAA